MHELTHIRQAQLQHQHNWDEGIRGVHRNRAWYSAISEACPNNLGGLQLPPSVWPTGSRTKRGTLTEVEMTHWPESLRSLSHARDERLYTEVHV